MNIALVRLVTWGVVAGASVALGIVMTRHMKEQAVRRRIIVAAVVGLALVLNREVISPFVVEKWKDHSARTPVERMTRYMQRVVEPTPEFKTWLRAQTAAGKTPHAAFAENAALAARGLLRLDDQQILERAALLRSALERVDDHTCAAMVFGPKTRDDMERLFAAFGDDQLREMATLNAEAILRELRGSPAARPPIDERQADSTMKAVAAGAPEEFRRLGRAAYVPDATDAQRCAFTRFMFSHSSKLDRREQLEFAVLLANQ